MDVAALGRRVDGLGARAAEQVGSGEGVATARRAAELARVLSLRDPEGADWIGRARAWFDRGQPTACPGGGVRRCARPGAPRSP